MTDQEHPPSEADTISFEWHRWAAVSLLRGTSLSDAVNVMSENGMSEVAAATLCARILSDATFESAKWAMGHLSKLESVLNMRQQMLELAEPTYEIERRTGLTRREFLCEYYSTNTPVVLEDVCDEWPARTLWSPEYLKEKLGAAEVEVMGGRSGAGNYEIEMNEHRTKMPFSEYVDWVVATEWSNDTYLTANNHLLSDPTTAELWNDFALDERYQKPDGARNETFLWFGPAGTVTLLHHDVMNILFHQIDGWKHFILISPMDTHRVSNSTGVYSDVDPLDPDLDRFPLFAGVRRHVVSVGPGDALFVPVGWWHHVTALERSISVSSTSFVYPNKIEWSNPYVIL